MAEEAQQYGTRGWCHKYTEQELEVIAANWRGEPPAQCKGKCRMVTFFELWCTACNWDEGTTTDTTDRY